MSGRKNLFIIIILVLIASNFAFIQAQEPTVKNNTFWLNFGLGVGAAGNARSGTAGNINVTTQFGKHTFTLRTTASGGLFKDSFWDIGLLYGWGTQSSHHHISGGIGLAIVGGTRSEGLFSETEEANTTIGVPLEIQLSWRPLRFLGFCAYAFANINSEESFTGFTICIQIGKLR